MSSHLATSPRKGDPIDNVLFPLEAAQAAYECKKSTYIKKFIAVALVVSAIFALEIYFLNQHSNAFTTHIGNSSLTYGAPPIGVLALLLGASMGAFKVFLSSLKPPQNVSPPLTSATASSCLSNSDDLCNPSLLQEIAYLREMRKSFLGKNMSECSQELDKIYPSTRKLDEPLLGSSSGFTLLHLAVIMDDTVLIEALTKRNASLFVKDKWDNTPFHRVRSLKALKLLCSADYAVCGFPPPPPKNLQEETPGQTIFRLCGNEELARAADNYFSRYHQPQL